MSKKREKDKRPAYTVEVTFETEAEAREFAIKVMKIPAPKWAMGIYRVAETYPK